MSRRRTRSWLDAHRSDAYVKRAQREGARSRAVYKLEEIDRRDRLIRSGMTVIDLGAAPGGWSVYAAGRVGDRGRVVALDLLPMDPVPGVTFLQGDFRDAAVLDELLAALGDGHADLVLSDMAPNLSGVKAADQARALHLLELALDLAKNVLKPGGVLLVKMFQGAGSDRFLQDLRGCFRQVAIRKPQASRSSSAEVYVLAKDYIVK